MAALIRPAACSSRQEPRARSEEPAQPGLAEPDHCVGIGVVRQKLQRGVAVVRPEHRIPSRSQQFSKGVEAGVNRGAALDHRGALLSQPPQRVGRALSGVGAQTFGVQERQPGQKLRIDPVILGVLGVVLTQIRRLGGRHHHHRRPAAPEPFGDHDPGVAGGLEHHGQLGRILQTQLGPQPLQLNRPGEELPAPPHNHPITRQRRLMRRPDRDVDPQGQCHQHPPATCAFQVPW